MKTKICIILLLFSMPFKMAVSDTREEQNFDNLLQAYNDAGQRYLFELQSGVQSSKTNWYDQYQFYKQKISKVLDRYVTSVQDDSKLCQEAMNIFKKYVSNGSNKQNVSGKIAVEEVKRNRDYRLSQLDNQMQDFYNEQNRYNQFVAIQTYCNQRREDERRKVFEEPTN
ncbi:MAG: hypothetical protein PHN45_07410 [Methylococcales bacterium]|nr:hypothetical protein [Methylococcales bacterium]